MAIFPVLLLLLLLVPLSIFANGAKASTVFISVNTTKIAHLDWVRVSFGGLVLNDSKAWLGVYYPASANVTTIAPLTDSYSSAPWTATFPLKYINCSFIPNCLETGAAYVDFRLENALTNDAKICLFTGGLQKPILLAETSPIYFTDTTLPKYGHLARTPLDTEMLVIWNSAVFNDTTAAVRWSLQIGGPYTLSTKAVAKTFTKEDMCGAPANGHGWFEPGAWYSAIISGLDNKGAIIYYQYGSEKYGWSLEESFLPVPRTGASYPIKVAVVADLGVAEYEGKYMMTRLPEPEATTIMQNMADKIFNTGSGYDYSMVLHAGDVAYSCGYQIKWISYMSQISSTGLGARVPYVLNQGNHERDFPNSGGGSDLYPNSKDSGGECGIPTEVRFPSPTTSSYKDSGWYSFTQGPAIFIMMNSEAQVAPGSAQYLFLETTLSTVDRSITPWVIVACHRPMYYVYSQGGKTDPVFTVIEPLLFQYKVDIFAGAHVHNTFASCPVYNGSCVNILDEDLYDAPIHLGLGNGGEKLDLVNATFPPVWMAYQASEHGHSTWDINSTTLTMRYYGIGSGKDEMHYEHSLQRKYPRTAPLRKN